MNKEKINELESFLSKMDLPFYRKKVNSKDSIRWLQKRLGEQNNNHSNYEKAMKIINELL